MPTKCLCDKNGGVVVLPSEIRLFGLTAIANALKEHRSYKNYTVDVIGLVLSVSIQHERHSCYLIVDPSIPTSTCAKVRIYDIPSIEVRVRVGDIFRFNSIVIKKDFGVDLDAVSCIKRIQVPITLCEFSPSWRIPEAGPLFAKLNKTSLNLLPPNMSTPLDVIAKLEKWFDEFYPCDKVLKVSILFLFSQTQS